MAIDIASVCATAASNHGSQTLAIVLSTMFSIYTVVAIALSALTIYSTSQSAMQPPGGLGTAVAAATAPMGVVSEGRGTPLVALRNM